MIGINFVQQTNVDESSISRKTSQYWSGQHHVGGQLFPISQILYLSAVRMVSVFSGQCLSVWILSVSILSVVQVLFGFLEPADMGKDAKKQRSVTHPSSPRIWPVSKGCPNFPDRSVRCLSVRYLSVSILSGFCLDVSKKRYPRSVYPTRQGRRELFENLMSLSANVQYCPCHEFYNFKIPKSSF